MDGSLLLVVDITWTPAWSSYHFGFPAMMKYNHFSPSDFYQDILSQQQVKNAKHPARPVTHIWLYQASGPYF